VLRTTGGQPVPNAKHVAYDLIARGAGYPRAHAFAELDAFASALPEILSRPGPVFVALKVFPEIENEPIGRRRRWQTRTRDQVVADLKQELGVGYSDGYPPSKGSASGRGNLLNSAARPPPRGRAAARAAGRRRHGRGWLAS
jgi:hypothetical protein